MKRVAGFAIAFVFAMSLLLTAEMKNGSTVYLQTSFDFTDHPACGQSESTNCIKAIRFYDADSRLPLAEVETKASMTGQQSIIGITKVSAIPHRVYAVTVYLDSAGRLTEGPRGQISEFINHASR